MIGQSDQRADIRIEGEVTSPDNARLSLRVEGTELDEPALELIQEGADTYLIKDGKRERIANPLGAAGPTSDFLGYLAAAKSIEVIEANDRPGLDRLLVRRRRAPPGGGSAEPTADPTRVPSTRSAATTERQPYRRRNILE